MDRKIVYPGSIPQDTDILAPQVGQMIGLGWLMQSVLGTPTAAAGLACTPAGSGVGVVIGPGCLTALTVVDTTAFGSLGTDADPLMKMGINTEPVTLTLGDPVTGGQSVVWLIEAQFLEADGSPVVLPYVNAANPAQPFSGPANSGAANNTVRSQRVALQAIEGTPATTGTQTVPATTSGWYPLYTVTLAYAAGAVLAGNIAVAAGAPFIPYVLPVLSPGFIHQTSFATPGTHTWTVPPGIYRYREHLYGGGGGGGGSAAGGDAAGAGGGGCYTCRTIATTPGAVITFSVAASGTAGAGGGANNGGTGGTTTGTGAASGGLGGSGAAAGALGAGGSGGALPVGGDVNFGGGNGTSGSGAGPYLGGNGGWCKGAFGGAGVPGSLALGAAGSVGDGGGGGANGSGGGAGGSGFVLVEY